MVKLLRPTLKAAAYAATAALAPMLMRGLPGSRLLILTYHRVLPPTHPAREYEEQGMMVSAQNLEMHLRLIGGYATFMHLDDWLDQRDAGATLPRLTCAVTFDDGWSDNYHHAFAVLQRMQIPATIFLATARIGTVLGFWPTTLGRLLFAAWQQDNHALIEALADRLPLIRWPKSVPITARRAVAYKVIDQLKKSYLDQEIDAALTLLAAAQMRNQQPDLLDWEQVRRMADTGLIKLGSHTRNHRRLNARLDAKLLDEEIVISAMEIAGQTGNHPGGFCYPNGDASREALHKVRNTYRYSVLNTPGINPLGVEPHGLKRIGLHDGSGASAKAVLGRLACAYLGVGN